MLQFDVYQHIVMRHVKKDIQEYYYVEKLVLTLQFGLVKRSFLFPSNQLNLHRCKTTSLIIACRPLPRLVSLEQRNLCLLVYWKLRSGACLKECDQYLKSLLFTKIQLLQANQKCMLVQQPTIRIWVQLQSMYDLGTSERLTETERVTRERKLCKSRVRTLMQV